VVTVPDTTRRERRRAQTRTELLAATRALLAEGGSSAVRISDVTARTDLALGSFYSHFASKEEAVEAAVEEVIGDLADRILVASQHLEDPAEAMSVGIRLVVGLCASNVEVARLLVNLDESQARFDSVAGSQALAVIEAGVAAGRFDIDDPGLVLTIATGAVLATIRNVLAGRHGADADVGVAVLLLRAVGLPRAEAEEIARRPLPPEVR
jgi:AcrR family transcriptional regulator